MNKAKILIIEDDKFLLRLYSDKFKKEGFEVLESLNGEEGLNKILTEKPDIVMLDLLLPGKNGFEILSDMKLNPEVDDIPVIIVTNLSQESDIKKGEELGVAAYLVKTEVSINKLVEAVKENLLRAKIKRQKQHA